jgi:hypothetical protein
MIARYRVSGTYEGRPGRVAGYHRTVEAAQVQLQAAAAGGGWDDLTVRRDLTPGGRAMIGGAVLATVCLAVFLTGPLMLATAAGILPWWALLLAVVGMPILVATIGAICHGLVADHSRRYARDVAVVKGGHWSRAGAR